MIINSIRNIIGASGSWEKYTVKSGDTLSGIAVKFHTTVEKLKAINGIKDANKIYVGQVLNIRGASTAGGSSSSGTTVNYTATTYTVVLGDTLSAIAERFGTTVSELQRLNNISNPNLIQVGQVLTIRGGSSSSYSSDESTITYTVVSGDTLSEIAQRYGTTVSELQRLNNISNPNLIQVGQVLTIRGGSSSSYSSDESTITYTVVSGDTLSEIAQRYGTTVSKLQRLNNISNPNLIQVGQVLTIRGGSSGSSNSGTSTITYVVVSGDTLSGIAARYGTTVSELQRLNNISNPNLIQVGQVLTIQGSTYGESTYNPSDNLPLNEEGFFVTANDLRKIGWKNISSSMVLDLNSCLRRFQINTVSRIRHFISQCSHESGGGIYTREIANGEAYNGRSDLGNIYPGDGPKFKGGGYIQLTGRYNYQQFANYMGDQQIVQQGVNYVASKYPWTSAGFWWHRNGMNALCDSGASVEAITLKVNGGYNGLADRKYWYNRCVQVITADSIEANNPSTNKGTTTPIPTPNPTSTPSTGSNGTSQSYIYQLPPKPNTSGYDSIFRVISVIEELERVYQEFKTKNERPDVTSVIPEVHIGVLNYLSRDYLKDTQFKLAVTPPYSGFYTYMDNNHSSLVQKLDRYIGSNRVDVKDNIDGLNDVAHLAVTTLAYATTPLAPKFWTGWGGDLATGMADVHNYASQKRRANLQKISDAIIGAHPSVKATYIKNLDGDIRCNYTDLCDDADAIGIARLLHIKLPRTHLLSDMMKEYYTNLTRKERYMNYQRDGLDFSSKEKLYDSVYRKMNGFAENIEIPKVSLFKNLKGESTTEEQQKACQSFARYLWENTH